MKDEYDIVIEENVQNTTEYVSEEEYCLDVNDKSETQTGDMVADNKYIQPLPSDLDIFENLSDDRLYSMPRAWRFLGELRASIASNATRLKGIHYNKLSLEESSRPGELMIDWIYNYFRAFYSFDDNEGDMYGLIVNNTETKQFVSEFKALNESEYDEVAAKSVSFITENLLR